MSVWTEFQKLINSEWVFKLEAGQEERWQVEYRRLGRKYAVWAAIFAIFGSPSHMFSELGSDFSNPNQWLMFRLGPSVCIAIALLLFKRFKFSHEIMFLVIAYALFVNFAYWPDCTATDNFLYGQMTMLIPAAIITLLRPFYFVINSVVQFSLIFYFYAHFCQETIWNFSSSKEFVPILIAAISSYIVATFRYYLIKRNFIFSLNLEEALKDAKEGRQKSDDLLKNILPEEIAEELKEAGNSDARGYDLVTILFTDFKDFTQYSEQMTAINLVREIDENFKAFDDICEKYKIEKIKTIGDAYMAAGGIPVPYKESVTNTVLAALEMQQAVHKRVQAHRKAGNIGFEMRVGLHTGPVVAGIVGIKKFQYDIWGDTVNTASRMESNGKIGKVNISQETYEIIKDDPQFKFESRGELEVKGKGQQQMYFVSI